MAFRSELSNSLQAKILLLAWKLWWWGGRSEAELASPALLQHVLRAHVGQGHREHKCLCFFFFFCIFVIPFSVNISTLPGNFQMECIELQSDVQLKNLSVSLYFDKPYLSRAISLIHNNALFMSWPFGSTCICERLFSRVKYRRREILTKISTEHPESSLRIAATAVKPAWCIGFARTGSHIPQVLCFCCSLFFCLFVLIKM